MKKWVRETAQKKQIENLHNKYKLFHKDQIINETARPKLDLYHESRVFQAGTELKSDQTGQEQLANIESLKAKHLNFQGDFVFSKLGYDDSKIFRAGSAKGNLKR